MKKTILTAILATLLFTACDDRQTFLNDLNEKPALSIQAFAGGAPGRVLTDSVKTSNTANNYCPFTLSIADANNNARSVEMQMLRGSGSLYYHDQQLSPGEIPVINNKSAFRFVPGTAVNGQVWARFIVTDQFRLKDSVDLRVTVFSNLPPVAWLYAVQVKTNDKYECSFDASGSFDQDKNFGGEIKRYIYVIAGEKIVTAKAVVHYIFPTAGSYVVKLQVEDNDGALSKEITQTITIN